MINTPWHAKIDAQQLFYFVILSVGGTLIDLSVSMKARLEIYIDAYRTLIFDKYEECFPKNHEKTSHAEMGTIGYNIKLQMLLLCWEVIMKNKNKRKHSARVSSHSLDEWTAAESQSNGLYLTSWEGHHNIVLCPKSCMMTEQHNVLRLW